MNNKEQIQELLEIMKIQGRKPHLVEKMTILMEQRSFKPIINTYKPNIINNINHINHTNKPIIPYPSLPPHIRRNKYK
jgi:hypothetical protein